MAIPRAGRRPSRELSRAPAGRTPTPGQARYAGQARGPQDRSLLRGKYYRSNPCGM